MTRTPEKNFQDLVAWHKSHEFVLSVYQLTRAFAREEGARLWERYSAAIVH
jgi:hypothetical protein